MSLSDNAEKVFYAGTFTMYANEHDIVGTGQFYCIPMCKN